MKIVPSVFLCMQNVNRKTNLDITGNDESNGQFDKIICTIGENLTIYRKWNQKTYRRERRRL